MANIEVKVPSPGESISEVRIAQWLVADGDVVRKDQVIAEIDSDKATLELSAEDGGKISLLAKADDTVNVGDVVAKIDTSVKPAAKEEKKAEAPKKAEPVQGKEEQKSAAPVAAPAPKEAVAAVHATPVAKAVMAEKGISGEQVKGTGPNGRISKSDVEAYLA
ncbi:MAG: E3 binding domain-containing protein, partial [Bacteroidetes bacterium]|nr:E3 binding domain-containing protein [Bacteroidota bacterium]